MIDCEKHARCNVGAHVTWTRNSQLLLVVKAPVICRWWRYRRNIFKTLNMGHEECNVVINEGILQDSNWVAILSNRGWKQCFWSLSCLFFIIFDDISPFLPIVGCYHFWLSVAVFPLFWVFWNCFLMCLDWFDVFDFLEFHWLVLTFIQFCFFSKQSHLQEPPITDM